HWAHDWGNPSAPGPVHFPPGRAKGENYISSGGLGRVSVTFRRPPDLNFPPWKRRPDARDFVLYKSIVERNHAMNGYRKGHVLVLSLLLAGSLPGAAVFSKEAKEPPRPKRGSLELGKGKPAQTDPARIEMLNGAFSKVVEA